MEFLNAKKNLCPWTISTPGIHLKPNQYLRLGQNVRYRGRDTCGLFVQFSSCGSPRCALPVATQGPGRSLSRSSSRVVACIFTCAFLSWKLTYDRSHRMHAASPPVLPAACLPRSGVASITVSRCDMLMPCSAKAKDWLPRSSTSLKRLANYRATWVSAICAILRVGRLQTYLERICTKISDCSRYTLCRG